MSHDDSARDRTEGSDGTADGTALSDGGTEEQLPVPEYERKQYLPTSGLPTARRKVLVEKFGPIRTYFKARPDEHFGLQRRLNQARLGLSYDVYLTRTVLYSVVVGLLCALLGLGLTVALSQLGVLAGIEAPISTSSGTVLSDIVVFIAANRVFFFGATSTLLLMFLGATVTWIAQYYYPYILVDSRRRNIDVMLPHAIVYMYALSYGGMDFVTVLKRMAEAEDTYGEVAHEFDMVVRDVEVFGNDLFTAIRNARNLTASENMETFLDDMLSVLDSGGNVTEFLRDESDKYMQRSQEEQKRFLEALAMLSEVFIVAFVAAPLFLIITLIMMTFLGSAGFGMLFAIVYLVLPLGMVGFIVLVSMLSEPYRSPNHSVTTDSDFSSPIEWFGDDTQHAVIRRIRLRRRLDTFLSAPLKPLRRRPELTLLFSAPLAAAYLGIAAVVFGTPSADGILSTPFRTTSLFLVAPFLVVATPMSIVHEQSRRQRRHVASRLPDALDILASSNQMGVSLVEGFGLVARNVTGRFAEELRHVRNDIRWNHDMRSALLSMADRMAVPQLTRTCKILAEGSRSTGNLHQVLKIAAQDTRHRLQMERAREQELQTYVAVVAIGFLVYLGTVVVIDQSFLAPVIERIGETESGELDQLINVGAGDVSTYNALFLHSALVQAVGTGLIIGELADSDVRSGLKYSIALVLVALAVFAFV
ncbi:type II secretion system F family protein [Natronomonas gomsonensis]|uniref:type II secretion system F family protein n=1 Tax=Natronomonas gomsonensis TaxID=1046043 RepID=UPI0020CA8296|nr:type II secretion system F family protein [Natronomonas gomsonensis]MCY4730948.1 type II secretion system F family protein [Natronomonas gomsonensis]